MSRVTKGHFHAARHSSLDEMTFNRDFDLSNSLGQKEKWNFHPSYSGWATPKVRYAQEKSLPVNMMDTFLSGRATLPQIVPDDQLATSMRVKANYNLRGFVTDKVTKVDYEPAVRDLYRPKISQHALVHDHEQSLIINMSTPTPYKFLPGQATPFRPLGAPVPTPNLAATRPLTTHEPGRHRFFVSDVRAKLP